MDISLPRLPFCANIEHGKSQLVHVYNNAGMLLLCVLCAGADDDFNQWSPHAQGEKDGCLLGYRETFDVIKPNVW